jgi:hypothetical protein
MGIDDLSGKIIAAAMQVHRAPGVEGRPWPTRRWNVSVLNERRSRRKGSAEKGLG